jgi:arylsulfatase
MATKLPNILVIFGDDIGYWNVSYNNHGMHERTHP